tara:strand:- start:13226 stop:13768 length:543 start_codon:yes stop_codon:yes gene_type:complete
VSDTLLLNADGRPISYLPISAVHWHISVKLKYLDKVRVVEEYKDRVIRSPSFEMKLPSVLMFYDYHFFPKTPKFSRTNVYLRDLFTCQYCGCRHDTQELTLDHVVPRSKGGHLNWENVVAACQTCNIDKGNKLYPLPNNTPYVPDYWDLVNQAKKLPITIRQESWKKFLQWPEKLVKIVA